MELGVNRPSRRFAAGVLLILASVPNWSAAVAAEAVNLGWGSNFEQALEDAKTRGRPVLATVSAVWCGACRQMQQLTLSHSDVSTLTQQHFSAVVIDGDQRSDLVARFQVTAFPTTFILDAQGNVLKRWVGYQSASSFAAELKSLVGSNPTVTDDFPPVSAIFSTNASPFEFGGFCLVSLLDDNKLCRGRGDFTATHRNVSVCFVTAAHRDRFLANPEKYWPVNNGQCLVTSQEHQQQEPGDPRVGVLWQNRLWFFADRERQHRFMKAPHRFAPQGTSTRRM